jgi:hypothetical protein
MATPKQHLPVWIWALIGLGGLGLVLFIAFSLLLFGLSAWSLGTGRQVPTTGVLGERVPLAVDVQLARDDPAIRAMVKQWFTTTGKGMDSHERARGVPAPLVGLQRHQRSRQVGYMTQFLPLEGTWARVPTEDGFPWVMALNVARHSRMFSFVEKYLAFSESSVEYRGESIAGVSDVLWISVIGGWNGGTVLVGDQLDGVKYALDRVAEGTQEVVPVAEALEGLDARYELRAAAMGAVGARETVDLLVRPKKGVKTEPGGEVQGEAVPEALEDRPEAQTRSLSALDVEHVRSATLGIDVTSADTLSGDVVVVFTSEEVAAQEVVHLQEWCSDESSRDRPGDSRFSCSFTADGDRASGHLEWSGIMSAFEEEVAKETRE